MLSVFAWNSTKKAGVCLDAAALQPPTEEVQAADVIWIDLDRPSVEEETLVFLNFLQVHPLTFEDVTAARRNEEAPHFPKVEEFADYLFIITNPLAPRFRDLIHGNGEAPTEDGRSASQLSAVLTKRVLITHHDEPVLAVEELHRYLGKHELKPKSGPDYLFHLILDAMVDHYAPLLDHFDESLDDLEATVLRDPSPDQLQTLLGLKRQIISFRKTLVYQREVLARLARGEFAQIDRREMMYYRNVYDHLIRFTELIDSSREMVSDLMQTHLAAVSNRLNEIMKVLTMISTIVLPMTLIAGIGTGGTTVTDHCTINVSPTYVPTLAYAQQIGAGLPILSLFINPTYDRLVTENWALQPVVSAHHLRDIGGAFQFLVARAEDGPDADTLSHLAEALSTENEPLEVLIPRGWYHVGTKHAVPADACFVGHHRQTYVWVTRDGVPGLSRFTLTVLQLAEAGEEKEAVAKKAEAGKAAAAHSERYDEVAPGSLPRRLEGTR